MSSGTSRFFGVVLSVGLTLLTVAGIAVVLDQAGRGVSAPYLYLLMAVVFGGAYLMLMRGPLGKAIARMLEGTPAHHGTLDRSDDIEELMARSGEDRLRLMDLEERLDFAERMLAQRSDAPQLPMHRTPV
jgi:hypothetical protein